MNFLSNISTDWLSFGVKQIDSIKLNWIANIIKFLIESVGITAVGIIIFTLIIKTIVLPLDVFSKYKTKRQSLIMERMRPQMEKLQKQYANDKNMYSQKVMELYKKNGYSMLGICLPSIVSLVIFIGVFSQFSTYSQYANLELYRGMVDAYNSVVTQYVDESRTAVWEYDESGNYKINVSGTSTDSYAFLIEGTDTDGETAYLVDFDAFDKYYKEYGASNYEEFNKLYESYKNYSNNSTGNNTDGKDTQFEMMSLIKEHITESAREAAADYYHKEVKSVRFLWVKNIWYPDSALEKEVPSFDDFVSSVSKASDMTNYEESYNEVTANLTSEKGQVNGYFVLIILAIAIMFLSQFFTMRMQKGMNELGTVDGSGKRTNKILLIAMPIIYGFLSFLYSAGFTIYMIANSTYSFLTTIIVNKSLNIKFKRMEERNELDRFLRKSSKAGKKRKKS